MSSESPAPPAPKRSASSVPQGAQPPYAFYGSNSSHSHDNGTGGRTYHIPNYATSYANDRSNLISVTFDENRGAQRIIIGLVFAILLFTAIPVSLASQKVSQYLVPFRNVDTGSVRDPGSAITAVVSPTSIPSVESTDLSKSTRIPAVSSSESTRTASWGRLVANSKCHEFGTREYSAVLRDQPLFASWKVVCNITAININGASYDHPDVCEKGWLGQVTGRWLIRTEDEECLPKWGRLKDKGCDAVGSGKRRFDSRLSGLKDSENWVKLCLTTPVVIGGKTISNPTSCYDWGIWGVYGAWEVEDPNC